MLKVSHKIIRMHHYGEGRRIVREKLSLSKSRARVVITVEIEVKNLIPIACGVVSQAPYTGFCRVD